MLMFPGEDVEIWEDKQIILILHHSLKIILKACLKIICSKCLNLFFRFMNDQEHCVKYSRDWTTRQWENMPIPPPPPPPPAAPPPPPAFNQVRKCHYRWQFSGSSVLLNNVSKERCHSAHCINVYPLFEPSISLPR